MKRFSKLHFIALFLLTTACRVSENSTEPSQVVNIEDKYEVKLPNSLTNQNNLYEQASLQYGDRKTDFFVAVIDENREEVNDLLYEVLKDSLRIRSKKAFAKKFKLRNYFEICRKGWAEANMMRPTAKQITETTINKYPAIVVETTEEVNGMGVFYVVAIIQTKKTYYHICTWTLANKKEKHYKQMKEIINSFKEL